MSDLSSERQPWQPPPVPVDLLHKCVCAYWLDVHMDGGQPVGPGLPGYENAALRMSDVLETLSIWIEQWADDHPGGPNAYDVAALLQRKAQDARSELTTRQEH